MTLLSKEECVSQVLKAIRSVVRTPTATLHEPTFGGNEWRYLQDCLDSTFVSSGGTYVERYESELAAYTGSPYVVAVSSGTAALQVALRSAGVESDDEVLIPALTFVATANAVTYLGAIPHFVDCDARTLGLDPTALRIHLENIADLQGGKCVNRTTGRVIRTVIPVHVFGHPMEIDDLSEVANTFGINIIEDAAESLGSTFKGNHTGTFGLAGVLSFNGNKIITTGGGGAILTNDPELASRASHLSTTAKIAHDWEYVHDEIGYNYRLPNLNAALGCAQLEKLPDLLERKRRLFDLYSEAFAMIEGVDLVTEPPGCASNYWLQTLCLDESIREYRDAILHHCHSAGFELRPVWTPLHWLKPYWTCPKANLPVSESLYRALINLPSSAHLA